MGLFNDDLNKAAIAIAKIDILLDDLEEKLKMGHSKKSLVEDFLAIAYIARVGVFDRAEKNNWPSTIPISIPRGLTKYDKTTLEKALTTTLGRLITMANNNELEALIVGVLDRDAVFYELEKAMPKNVTNSF